MTKNGWLALLVCVNLALLAALIVELLPPRAAFAQGTGLAGSYLAVSGRIQSEFDGLYLLDTRERTLHAFYFEYGSRELQYAGYRDLDRDFRNNP